MGWIGEDLQILAIRTARVFPYAVFGVVLCVVG